VTIVQTVKAFNEDYHVVPGYLFGQVTTHFFIIHFEIASLHTKLAIRLLHP
jgi:hypothetical protein